MKISVTLMMMIIIIIFSIFLFYHVSADPILNFFNLTEMFQLPHSIYLGLLGKRYVS